jgi:hypothetical protein
MMESISSAAPAIFIKFEDGGCTWMSCGWKSNVELMAKAKRAINEAKNEDEVVELLKQAGFDVHIEMEG